MAENLLDFIAATLECEGGVGSQNFMQRVSSPFIIKEYCNNGGRCCKLTKSVVDEYRFNGQLSTIVNVWRAELAPLSQLHAAIDTVTSSLHFWAKQASLSQRLVFDALVDVLDALKSVDWTRAAEAMSKNIVFLSWQSSAQTGYAERAEIGALELIVREKRSMNSLFAKSYCVDLYCYFFVGDGNIPDCSAPKETRAAKLNVLPLLKMPYDSPVPSPRCARVSRSLPGSPRHRARRHKAREVKQ